MIATTQRPTEFRMQNQQRSPTNQPRQQYGLSGLLQNGDSETRAYAADALTRMEAAAAAASQRQIADIRRMNQTAETLQCKLQEAEIVRAEVQEDARQKSEQLRALNQERLLLMSQIQQDSLSRGDLQQRATHRTEAVRELSVQKNLLLMKLHDQSQLKTKLASSVKQADERLGSMVELNTQLVSKLHERGGVVQSMGGDLSRQGDYLSSVDSQSKTLVGMIKAEESARQKQAAECLRKDEEIRRLSQYNYEATNKLSEKDRMLRTQGEQLRLMRDRTSQVHNRNVTAQHERHDQRSLLQQLNNNHNQLTTRLAADGRLF